MRLLGLVLLGCCLPGQGETACFRTAQQAALQAGVRDGEGFRLEGIRIDRVGGSRWARVVSCLHPERPGVALKMAQAAGEPGNAGRSTAATVQTTGRPAVEIGTLVRVVQLEANVHLELAGVAQASGAVGERVRVRVGQAGEERFIEAVVRGFGLVALEGSR